MLIYFCPKSILTISLSEWRFRMEESEFSALFPGSLVGTNGGLAFLPDPLPPDIKVDWTLASAISEADRALSELAGIARTLPNPHLLIQPFVRKEAVLSSKIEGTQTSLSEFLIYEGTSEDVISRSHDINEVKNYILALEFGLNMLSKMPVSLRLLKSMHEILMTGVRGESLAPGEFRRIQNWIGPPGTNLANATFVPPPINEMDSCLDQLEKYIHEPSGLPPLVKMALIHYQFETIHPFLDGNGRIGRLLITLLMCAEGILPQPLLYLSAYFERHKGNYYELLLRVSQKGDWQSWIEFFLNGVKEQSLDAMTRSKRLLDLLQDYRGRLQSGRSSALLMQIVEFLFMNPVVSAKRLEKRLNITKKAAQLNIDKLESDGILFETTGKKRNRLYLAKEIMRTVEG